MNMKKSVLRFLVLLVLSLITLTFLNSKYQYDMKYFNQHEFIVEEFYSYRKDWITSNLGSFLFKNQDLPQANIKNNKTFVILIWKYWTWLQNRHKYSFGSRSDPLDECSVRNCRFVGNDTYLKTADAVVVHIQHGLVPNVKKRNPHQRWVFLSDEAPPNTFSMSENPPTFSKLANIFNWSMTYRSDSDVPVPYGRTVSLSTPVLSDLNFNDVMNLIPNWKKKRRDVMGAILMSNCMSYRMKFLKDLKQYVAIDIYGKCSDSDSLRNSCPGHFKSDCEEMSKYLFYLVLENSMCYQYLSEKSFYHAYSKGAIPVIKGPLPDDCKKLLPPNSYLHVDNYATMKDLAEAMIEIGNNKEIWLSYHLWRNDYEVLNEHGFFGSKSYHLCRLCEAMNYNDGKEKVYNEHTLKMFLDRNILCK